MTAYADLAVEGDGAKTATALKQIAVSKGRVLGNFYAAVSSDEKSALLCVTLAAKDKGGQKALVSGKSEKARKEVGVQGGAKIARGVVKGTADKRLEFWVMSAKGIGDKVLQAAFKRLASRFSDLGLLRSAAVQRGEVAEVVDAYSDAQDRKVSEKELLAAGLSGDDLKEVRDILIRKPPILTQLNALERHLLSPADIRDEQKAMQERAAAQLQSAQSQGDQQRAQSKLAQALSSGVDIPEDGQINPALAAVIHSGQQLEADDSGAQQLLEEDLQEEFPAANEDEAPDYSALISALIKARVAAKPHAFAFCAVGASGEPDMAVGPTVTGAALAALRGEDPQGDLVVGQVAEGETGRLLFYVTSGDELLREGIRALAPSVPPLKGAIVTTGAVKPPKQTAEAKKLRDDLLQNGMTEGPLKAVEKLEAEMAARSQALLAEAAKLAELQGKLEEAVLPDTSPLALRVQAAQQAYDALVQQTALADQAAAQALAEKRQILAEEIENDLDLKPQAKAAREAEAAREADVAEEIAFESFIEGALLEDDVESDLYGSRREREALAEAGLPALDVPREELRVEVMRRMRAAFKAAKGQGQAVDAAWAREQAWQARLEVLGVKTADERAAMGGIRALSEDARAVIDELAEAIELKTQQDYEAILKRAEKVGERAAELKANRPAPPLRDRFAEAFLEKVTAWYSGKVLPIKDLASGKEKDLDKMRQLLKDKKDVAQKRFEEEWETWKRGYTRLLEREEAILALYADKDSGVQVSFDQAVYAKEPGKKPLLADLDSGGVCASMCMDWAANEGSHAAVEQIHDRHVVGQAFYEMGVYLTTFSKEMGTRLDVLNEEKKLPKAAWRKGLEDSIAALNRRLDFSAAHSKQLKAGLDKLKAAQQKVESAERKAKDELERAERLKMYAMDQDEESEKKRQQRLADIDKALQEAHAETEAAAAHYSGLLGSISPRRAASKKLALTPPPDDEKPIGFKPEEIGKRLREVIARRTPKQPEAGTFYLISLNHSKQPEGHAISLKMESPDQPVEFLDPNAGVFRHPTYEAFLAWAPKWYAAFYNPGDFDQLQVTRAVRKPDQQQQAQAQPQVQAQVQANPEESEPIAALPKLDPIPAPKSVGLPPPSFDDDDEEED